MIARYYLYRAKDVLLVIVFVYVIISIWLFFFTNVLNAAPNQIDGRIYHDQNNNGSWDTGESGVPNVLVTYGSSGSYYDLTDSNGDYVISGVSGSGRVTVHTGWLRSACNSQNCSAGTPGENDFPVANQIITLTGVDASTGATLDAGLVPAWNGTYPIPSPPIPSNDYDIALRLTYAGGCDAGTVDERLCTANDDGLGFIVIMNQGTSSISNPVFLLEAPVGVTINDASWTPAIGGQNAAHPSANTVSALTPFDSNTGRGLYKLNGTLPAGSNSSMQVTFQVGANPPGSPTPYATDSPRSAQFIGLIVGSDQTETDWDSGFCESDGTGTVNNFGSCSMGQVGTHNKLTSPDHSDTFDIQISEPYSAPTYDAAIDITKTDPGTQLLAGSEVDFTVTLSNQGANNSPIRDIEVQIQLPSLVGVVDGGNSGWIQSGSTLTSYHTSQILPGKSSQIPIKLRISQNAALSNNGTDELKLMAQIIGFKNGIPDASDIFQPITTETDLDDNIDNYPVVLGASSVSGEGSGELAKTGVVAGSSIIGTLFVVATAYTYFDYRRHRAPILEAEGSNGYTYWHHIKMVTIPTIKYRLNVSLEKRLPDRSDRISRF